MLDVDFGSVVFLTVANATSYKIERRLEGGQWEVIGTVPDENPDSDSEEMVFASELIIAVGFYRAIATNAVGDSLPSAPLLLDFPEENSSNGSGGNSGGNSGGGPAFDVCPGGPSESLLLQRFQIKSYVDGLFQNEVGASASANPAWDGIFYVTFHGIKLFWASGEGGPFPTGGQWSNQGQSMCHVRLYMDTCSEDGTPTWRVAYLGGDTGGHWEGSKIGGETPLGVYTVDLPEYLDFGPASLEIEASVGSTTEAGNLGCSI